MSQQNVQSINVRVADQGRSIGGRLLLERSGRDTHACSWQGAHHELKCSQGRSIRGKGPQETRTANASALVIESHRHYSHKTSPITSKTSFAIDLLSCISPPRELPFRPQLIRHDPLLHHIAWIARYPEHLRTEATSKEIDHRSRQTCILVEIVCKKIITPPPEEEKRAEEQGRAKPMIQSSHAVLRVYLPRAINRTRIEPL